jgi:uncharacterized RDD family membrane protein YckC
MACALHPEVDTGLERCERCGVEFCSDCLVVLRDRPYCAGCKLELVRDLRSGIVPGELALASIGRRLVGLWIDGFVTTMASYAIIVPVSLLIVFLPATVSEDDGAGWVGVALLAVIYPALLAIPVVYEALMLKRRGQTLGKMAVKIEVVSPDGNRISGRQAWSRAALKLVLGSCVGIDYIPAFFTRERTCLHDMIARTRVVKRL